MQKIYLAKPGGQKEGPYTLDQINRDLAMKKYSEAEFWAWHEGLAEWVPLHALRGLSASAGVAPLSPVEPKPKSEPEVSAAKSPAPAAEAKPAPKVEAHPKPAPEAKPEPVGGIESGSPALETKAESPEVFEYTAPPMSSGKPFAALTHIFVLTTGEGPAAFKSEVTSAMLEESAGEDLANVRAKVPVDVVGHADLKALEAVRAGSIPHSVWRALSAIKPAIVQQAQEGAFHLCARTFPMESNTLVALLLLYDKQKL